MDRSFTDFSIHAVDHGIDKYKKSRTGKTLGMVLLPVTLYDDVLEVTIKDQVRFVFKDVLFKSRLLVCTKTAQKNEPWWLSGLMCQSFTNAQGHGFKSGCIHSEICFFFPIFKVQVAFGQE